MWAVLLFTLFQLSPPAHVRLVRDSVATVTGLAADATTIPGQAILTFTGIGAEGDGTTYGVYRHTAQITSGNIGSATLVGTLDQYSRRNRHNDASGQNLTSGFIVTQGGSHLAAGTGLVVMQPASSATRFYAVTNSTDATVTVGVNSLTAGVAETYRADAGAVYLGSEVIGNYTIRHYSAWENFADWVHASWGTYHFRFDVNIPSTGISAPFPLTVELHAAPSGGYFEPDPWPGGGSVNVGLILEARDNDFSSTSDPYTGGTHAAESWFGNFHVAEDVWKATAVERIARFARLVRDNAIGDGFDFQVNSARVYILGASMGSMSMKHAIAHPELYAAAETRIGFIDNSHGRFPNGSKKVGSAAGDTADHYLDPAYQASIGVLPPIIHQLSANDGTANPDKYDEALAAFETYRQPFAAEWTNDDHQPHAQSAAQWNFNTAAGSGLTRFLRTEAYPAFGGASTSTAIPSFPNASAGQRNGTLDWQSSLHLIAGGSSLLDTSNTFRISLVSSSSATGVTTTIRNAQSFRPQSNVPLTWSTSNGQSGTATRNSDGSVTVTNLSIPTSALELTVQAAPPAHVLFAGAAF